jgi:hypothetical protein
MQHLQNRYLIGGMLAVLLTAMVLGTAAAGTATNSHFLASVGPKIPAIAGERTDLRFLAPATSSIVVTVTWASDNSGVFTVPIGGATVVVTDQAGAFVASGVTNSQGQAVFKVNSPALYKVDVDVENVSSFGYLASHEYTLVQTTAGSATNAMFQYVQPGPNIF